MLAYYDTPYSLLKCKVIDTSNINPYNKPLNYPANSDSMVKVKLTVSKGPYKKGEIIESSLLHVIPRNKVYLSSGQYRIKPYTIGDFIKG